MKKSTNLKKEYAEYVVREDIDDNRYKMKNQKENNRLTAISIIIIIFGIFIFINTIIYDSILWLYAIILIGMGIIQLYWGITGKYPFWGENYWDKK
jgi:hypothetical protein